MTNDRAPMGTTAADLEAVRAALRPEDGWRAEEVADADAPWITASAPDGTDWAIGRKGGEFFAVSENGAGTGWDGLTSAWDAACFVAEGRRAA